MTDIEIRTRMSARLLTAQTPWGRAQLNFYVKSKRIAWNIATSFAHLLKRLFDIAISLIAMVMLSPVFIFIAIAVKLDGGPIFFRQTRFGHLQDEGRPAHHQDRKNHPQKFAR